MPVVGGLEQEWLGIHCQFRAQGRQQVADGLNGVPVFLGVLGRRQQRCGERLVIGFAAASRHRARQHERPDVPAFALNQQLWRGADESRARERVAAGQPGSQPGEQNADVDVG